MLTSARALFFKTPLTTSTKGTSLDVYWIIFKCVCSVYELQQVYKNEWK